MKKVLFTLLILLLMLQTSLAQTNGSFLFEDINRSYIVYVPQQEKDGEAYPLMIVLHGFTQTGQAIMNYSDFNTYAELYGFVAVYPNGVGNSWNVGVGGGSTANDVGFLSALIDTLNQQTGIDLNRVYACGFSNGGFMSYRLACELSDQIAAIGPVAGVMVNAAYDACAPGKAVPVIHIHGTSDFIVSYNGTSANKSVSAVLELWTQNNECVPEPEVVDLPDLVQEGSTVQQYTWSPCLANTEVVHLKVNGGGHTWPGAIGNSGIGNTNQDIIASEEIWKFVSRFNLDGLTGLQQTGDQNHQLQLFPNPATDGKTLVTLPVGKGYASIHLTNLQGLSLKEWTVELRHETIELSLHGFKTGVYILHVQSGRQRFVEKLMILN
jgi:polyhydroxybutyrate depolymerase